MSKFWYFSWFFPFWLTALLKTAVKASCLTKSKTLKVGNGEEFHFFLQNHTWDLVKLLFGKRAIKCKLVFQFKTNVDGVVQSKTRLVVKGCFQCFGFDFIGIYSLVVHFESKSTLFYLSQQLTRQHFFMVQLTKTATRFKLQSLNTKDFLNMFIIWKNQSMVCIKHHTFGIANSQVFYHK